MITVGRDVLPCDFVAKIDFVLHNLTDMGVFCKKMMGSKFSNSISPFWAPINPRAHSKTTHHLVSSRVNRCLQILCHFLGFRGC